MTLFPLLLTFIAKLHSYYPLSVSNKIREKNNHHLHTIVHSLFVMPDFDLDNVLTRVR